MEKQNVFLIAGRYISIKDLRNKEMMKAFEDLYTAHFGFQGINFERFRENSLRFFDICEKRKKKYEFHRRFFVNFTNLWQYFMSSGNIEKAKWIWEFALKLAYEWEKNNNKRIHKGTPYYFYAVTNIIAGDIPNGFLLMHQAFREDQETDKIDFPKTPAYSFITLDYENIHQYFLPKVREIAFFLDDRIKEYINNRESNLNLDDFKQKFLKNKESPLIIDVVYYFVYSLFQLNKLFNIGKEVTENKFASMLEADIMFNLCVVLDKIIAYKNPDNSEKINKKGGKKYLYLKDQIGYLFNKKINFIDRVATDVKKNGFDKALEKLLSSQFKNFKFIEEDFAISYICRNYRAHNIKGESLIYKNFKDIIQRILNSIFYSVEKLY